MAVSVETSEVEYSGNDSTDVFPTTFYFLEEADLVVTLTTAGTAVVQTLTTDYTVSGEGDEDGGTVTMLVPPATGTTLNIARVVDITQPTDFTGQGTFSPSVHEEALDRGTMIDQQLDRRLSALEASGDFETVVAGSGLTLTGDTLAVGAGSGITVAADSVAVSFGDASLMNSITKASATAGAQPSAARIDHKHNINTASPAATSVRIGNTTSEGTSTSLSRADHIHPVASPAAPADVTKAAASAGSAVTFARADHKHDITTAAAATITTANAEGSATSLARSDHTHNHGALLGGDRHAVATTSANGFMSTTQFDTFGTAVTAAGDTTDATPTVIAASVTPDDQNTVFIEATVIGARDTANQSAGYRILGTFRRDAGTTTQVGSSTAVGTHEDDGTWAAAFSISGAVVSVTVTGAAATNISWKVFLRYWQIAS